jgi:hypothetical protein
MHFITRHTWISHVTTTLVSLTWVITQLHWSRVLSEQSTSTPSGQHRVAVLVKVKMRSTVSSAALGLVRVTGTLTAIVMVKNPSPTGVLLTSTHVISAPGVNEQATGVPTVNVPVGHSLPIPVVTVVSLVFSSI